MKILFLQDDFPPQSFGGAGISTYELALVMKELGHDVSVVTTCRKDSEAGESEYDGLKIYKITSNYHERWRAYASLYNRQVIKNLEKILQEIKPDVVHINNIHTYLSYHSLKTAKKYAKVVILTFRDVMAFNYGKLDTKRYLENLDAHTTWLDHIHQAGKRWNPFRNILIKYYLRYADRRIAISQALKNALAENGIYDVEVIYNGIDLEGWEVSAVALEQFQATHGLKNKRVVFFNGRLSPAKGSPQALRALALIQEEVPEAVLLVAGTGEVESKPGVIFTGWLNREGMKLAYTASHVVLMPSVCFDAFGRVNIEAMASRKPVVGTCFGGTPEVVEHGVTGYIVNPLYPEEIATRTLELLTDRGKAEALGEAGYKRAERLFNLKDKAQEYVRLYQSL